MIDHRYSKPVCPRIVLILVAILFVIGLACEFSLLVLAIYRIQQLEP